MQQLVRRGSGHPDVRLAAEEAVAGVHPRDYEGQVRAVADWITSRTEYRRDPLLDEWLQTPWHVIRCQIRQGRVPQIDCDDLTDLSLAMLGSIGFPSAFRAISNRPDRRLNHVYGLIDLGRDGIVALDLTRAWARPGASPPIETRVMVAPALGTIPMASALGQLVEAA